MQSLRAAGIHRQCLTSSAESVASFPKNVSCGPGLRPQMALTTGSWCFLFQKPWSWGHGLFLFFSSQVGKAWVNNYIQELSQIICWIRLIPDLNNNWVSLLPPTCSPSPLLVPANPWPGECRQASGPLGGLFLLSLVKIPTPFLQVFPPIIS